MEITDKIALTIGIMNTVLSILNCLDYYVNKEGSKGFVYFSFLLAIIWWLVFLL